jgi:ABC-2 type transport system ATP-binding protein
MSNETSRQGRSDHETGDREDIRSMVVVDHVTKDFGSKRAVSDLSFDVPAGQICGLLGPNGAGKTTLFRLLMGILKATSGRLLVNGFDAFEDRVEAKRQIGYLPDEPIFYSYLSAREILELSAAMHGLDPGQAMERMEPVIARMKLSDEMDNYAEDYSRGMKKKLGLLLAMLHEPRLLVLDEPTNGLDVESTRLFYEMIAETAASGTTVLFSTHLMDHVARLCSHAVVIGEGKLVANGSLDELRAMTGLVDIEDIFVKLTAKSSAAGEETEVKIILPEKTDFLIILKDAGADKIETIKLVREVTSMSIKEAKDLVEGAPGVLKENATREAAESIVKRFAGVATIEIR